MSLKRILEEEAELEKQMFGSESSEEPTTTPEAPSEDPDDSYVEDDPITNDGFPEPTKVIAQDVQEDEPSVVSKQRQSWKQRYTNFKASADKTIFTLRKENAALRENVGYLNVEVSNLKSELQNLKNSNIDIFSGVITPEDSETIGEDAVDIVKRTSQRAIEASVAPLKERIRMMEAEKEEERKRQDLAKARESYNTFLKNLEKKVKDYTVIDKDPRFSEYLDGFDEYTGEKRWDIFKRAEDYRDADRVADFFMDFKRTLPRSKKERLEEHITPDSSSSASELPKERVVETFTSEEVEKFYNDITKGVYRNRRKEAEDLEARITKAYIEGRIR